MFAQALLWLVICDVITIVVMLQRDHKIVGPSDFLFQSLSDCDGVDSVVRFGITQKKYNRSTNVLEISFGAPYDLGDDIVVELKGSLKKDGGYKPGAYYMKDTLCNLLKSIVGDIANDILSQAGSEGCPIPAGDYIAEQYYFDNKKFNVPQVFGDYRMEVFVYKDEVLQSCYLAYYELKQKCD
ncbi:uncharacterized protein LOC135077513 [Ostrinia nubilalis]|uniref:uncharacterized protein LOC135077513 n=1 Tax=Ostrinia nubilalis TaxID=29057 RepID=UPI0030825274